MAILDRQFRTGLVADDRFLEHDTGMGHPESPARYLAVMDGLETSGLAGVCTRLSPVRADEAFVRRVHATGYIEQVREDVEAGRGQLSTGDTAISERSYETALLAAGGARAAVDAVLGGVVDNAFCVMRPAGHHASRTRGMGFCIFNNVALAARHAQHAHGIERVLIVDWDVHHGNGTQDIFYGDDSVLFFDTHQSPLYPGTGKARETGRGRGKGFTINCPLPAGAGLAEIRRAYAEKLAPAAERFAPQLVIISAGFDGHVHDPLGGFTLTDQDFAELTRDVMAIAGATAGGRIVSILEGGYSLTALAGAAAAHVAVLTGRG